MGNAGLAGLAFLALLAATALVPYGFPPSAEVVGASSELGFNNTVAYACYVLFAILAAIPLTRLLPAPTTAEASGRSTWARISWPVFLVVTVPQVVFFAAIYLYRGRFVFADAGYFQLLLHRMTQGDLPAIDFSYYYGPAMLYPAFWLTRMGTSLEAAYALYFVASSVAGLLMLYILVGSLVSSRRVAAFWFAFLAIGLFSAVAALNFGLLRFLLPSATLLTFSLYAHEGARRSLVMSTSLLAVSLLYSIEVGALAVGGVLLLSLSWIIRYRQLTAIRRGLLVIGVAVGLALLFFVAIDPSGRTLVAYPYSLLERLGGEHNLPVTPHLAFVVIAMITVFSIAGWLRLLAVDARRGASPFFVVAYLPVALLAQRASLAVNDPRNLAFFGLPAILLVLHIVSRFQLGSRAHFALALTILFGLIVPVQVGQAGTLIGFVNSPPIGTPTQVSPGAVSSTRDTIESTITEMARQGGTDRPYYMYQLDYYSIPVYRRLGLRYATFDSTLISVTSNRLARRMVAEVRSSNALVIIRRTDLDGVVAAEQVNPSLEILSRVTGAPIPGTELIAVVERNHARVRAILLDFIRAEMHPLHEANGLVLLSR